MYGRTLRNCLFLFSGIVGIISPAAMSLSGAADVPDIRVMSFNIRYGKANDGDDAWPNRHKLVASTIRTFSPDLLGTQETLPFQAEYISSEFPEYSKVGWTREKNPNGEQCAIFYRTERFELVDSGQFWLSETPEKKYSRSWDSSLPRVATWAVLRDRNDSSKELVHCNTHFDHRGAKARLESARLIYERAEELDGVPIILTGDFNSPESSAPWTILTSSNLLRDTRRVVHPQVNGPEGTFNGFKGTSDGGRIDWILATKHFTVRSADIDRSSKDGRYPSDHFPVTTVLRQTD